MGCRPCKGLKFFVLSSKKLRGCHHRSGIFSRVLSGSRPRMFFSTYGRREEIPVRIFVACGGREPFPRGSF